MRDIGNGDDQLEAVAIRFGIDGIIKIACVGPINGDQRHVAQISAIAQRRGTCVLGFGDGRWGEFGRDVVRRDHDQADRAGVGDLAEPFHHPRRFQPERPAGQRFGAHHFAILGALGVVGRDRTFCLGAAVGGFNPAAAIATTGAEHAHNAAGGALNAAQGAAFIHVPPARADARQDALAGG